MNLWERFIAALVVAASFMPAVFLHAQGTGKPSDVAMGAGEPDTPKIDIFLGYSYFRAVPTLAAGNRMVDLNGGEASVAFNLKRNFGIVADFGGYDDTKLQLAGPGANPPGVANSSGTVFTYLAGPRLSYRNHSRITPFAQILFGAVHASEVSLSGCTGSSCTPLPTQTAFAMTAGGGIDIRASRHFSIRAIQAEYMMNRFANPTTGASGTQNDLRLSAGFVFSFGGNRPQAATPSPVMACSIDSRTADDRPGDAFTMRARVGEANNVPLNYIWTANDGTIEGSGPEVRWNLPGVKPGVYTVNLRVDEGRGATADCSADVRVEAKVNPSPTIVCSADRTSITAGEPVQVTAVAGDPQQASLTFSWSASGGKIIGSGSSVRFDTLGLPTGRYTVMGHLDDGRGGAADCSVNVDSQAPTPLEVRLALHSIYFPTAQPSAEDPTEGLLESQKQILISLADDFKLYLESKPDAHLILEGHADPRGSEGYNLVLSRRRVESTKRFLMDRGVPAANIETKAIGVQQNLTELQVKDAVEQNPELTPADRQNMLLNMTTITLASNRRVDVTLSTTGQRSLRQYPFNAADSLALLNQAKAQPR